MKKRLAALAAAAALMLTACSSPDISGGGGISAAVDSLSGAERAAEAPWSAYAGDNGITSEAGYGGEASAPEYAAEEAPEPEISYEDSAGGYAHYAEGGSRAQKVYPGEELPYQPAPQAGVLTAGRIKDNDDWTAYSEALKREDWAMYQRDWALSPENRIAVSVTAGSEPLAGCLVTAHDRRGQVLWRAVADSAGKAYLFPAMFSSQNTPAEITAQWGVRTESAPISGSGDSVQIDFGPMQTDAGTGALDLMLVMDTTGSMSDELDYLSAELVSVVNRVLQQNDGLDVRTSVNFYRDEGDEYVTRNFPFTSDASESQSQLQEQYADGGGDYEEALDQALYEGVEDHDWRSPVRILFLVMDAPPHNRGENYELKSALVSAAAKGIRIVPVASSGVDENAEFLMRTLAAATGGQYLFLTDDSEVGNDHKDPTAQQYETGHLNDLMVKVIQDYLAPGTENEASGSQQNPASQTSAAPASAAVA